MPATPRRLPPAIADLAEAQSRHLRLDQLAQRGVDRNERRAHVEAERWQAIPYRGVVTDCGPTDEGRAAWWSAVVGAGCRGRLGGMSALAATGLTGWRSDVIHLWVPKSSKLHRQAGVVVHESRRWSDADAAEGGIPRARPHVATVQAALWADSPRQAVLCLTMPIQQRLVRPDEVATELDRVKRHRFRSVLRSVIADIGNGAHSLNELDFASMCRDRGLPEPSRQAVRRGPRGRIYLDVYWRAYGVAVEVNGAGHDHLEQAMRDEVRLMELQLQGDVAAQISVLTLRCDPDPFFRQLARMLASRGWTR